MAKQLKIPTHISDGMVLQQQTVFRLAGWARAGTQIHMSWERTPFDGRDISPIDQEYGCLIDEQVQCGQDGCFVFEIPLPHASFDPFTLHLQSGKEALIIRDIRVGEVWLSAGHSDLTQPLGIGLNHDRISDLARFSEIRILRQSSDGLNKKQKIYSDHVLQNLPDGKWIRADDVNELSAVEASSFYFARDLQLELNIPIGVIETSMSRTFAHAWMPRERIDEDDTIRTQVEGYGFYRDSNTWNMAGDWGHHQPGALFNHKIAPLAGFGLRGLIWHQGEKDRNFPIGYRRMLQKLIQEWNSIVRTPDPLMETDPPGPAWIFIGAPPACFKDDPDGFSLAKYTEVLFQMRHKYSGPAAVLPTWDLITRPDEKGRTWYHPDYPFALERLGAHLKTIALGLCYQRKAPAGSPECTGIELVGNKMMISFKHAGDGLRLTGSDSRLRGFAICGPDRIFREAQARILYGVRVMVWHDQISQPCSLTYAFSSMNQEANLINREHLPAVPFRADKDESFYKLPMEWLHCDRLETWASKTPVSNSNSATVDRTDEQLPLDLKPAWKVWPQDAVLQLETANKQEGEASILLTYKKTVEEPIRVEPCLMYESQFPPLDLSHVPSIEIELFNPDRHMKKVALRMILSADGNHVAESKPQILPAALRWQNVRFDLDAIAGADAAQVYGLAFCLMDEKSNGSLYMDNIRFKT